MKKKLLVMSFGSDAGGIERSLIEFLRFLETSGQFDIDLYLWRSPGTLFDQIPPTIHIINERLVPGSLREVKSCSGIVSKLCYLLWYVCFRFSRLRGISTLAFKSFVGTYDIAISYCQNGYSPYYIIDKVKADRKYIWYHHGSYERNGRQRRMDEHYFGQYDRIVTVSHACRDTLGHAFPALKEKMMVIANLIDGEAILQKAKQEPDTPLSDKLNIVTVGRLSREKGPMLALHAAKILHRQGLGFTWYFVGDGPEYAKCRAFIEENGLTEICLLLGAKPNPYPWMKKADIYVQPSYVEADPLTIKEAKFLQKLIISTDIPATRETLREGDFGLLCLTTPESLVEGIRRILSEPELRLSLMKNLAEQGEMNSRSEQLILSLLV